VTIVYTLTADSGYDTPAARRASFNSNPLAEIESIKEGQVNQQTGTWENYDEVCQDPITVYVPVNVTTLCLNFLSMR